jgi:molybdopterin biosynthesis enzyme
VSAGKYDLVEDVLAEFGAEFLFTGVKMQPGKPAVFGRIPSIKPAGQRVSESASQRVSESAGQRVSESATPPASDLKGTGFSPSASAVKSRGALAPGLLPAVASQTFSDAGEWTYFFGLPGNPVSTQVTFHCFVEPLLRAMCGAGVAGPKFVQATLAEDVRAKIGLTRILPARLTHDFARPEVRLVGWQGSGDLAANARANCYAVLPDGRDLKAGDVISVLLR